VHGVSHCASKTLLLELHGESGQPPATADCGHTNSARVEGILVGSKFTQAGRHAGKEPATQAGREGQEGRTGMPSAQGLAVLPATEASPAGWAGKGCTLQTQWSSRASLGGQGQGGSRKSARGQQGKGRKGTTVSRAPGSRGRGKEQVVNEAPCVNVSAPHGFSVSTSHGQTSGVPGANHWCTSGMPVRKGNAVLRSSKSTAVETCVARPIQANRTMPAASPAARGPADCKQHSAMQHSTAHTAHHSTYSVIAHRTELQERN